MDWIGLDLGDEQGRAYLRGREEEEGAPCSILLPLSPRSGGGDRDYQMNAKESSFIAWAQHHRLALDVFVSYV